MDDKMKPAVKGASNPKTSEDKKMVDKVNQQLAHEEDSLMARIIGLGLILLGVVFVVLAVSVVFLSRRAPQIDETLATPTFDAIRNVNEEEARVIGESRPDSEVLFYVNGREVSKVVETDSDGMFDGYVSLGSEEGEYELQAVLVEGFPMRKRSKKSDVVKVVLDTTPPSAQAELNYDPVSEVKMFKLSGTIEPNTIIKLSSGEMEYLTTSDEEGIFEMEGIELTALENAFDVTLLDVAGNSTDLEMQVKVRYTNYVADSGDLNGDGVIDVVDPDLPEASGELQAALETLAGNRLMVVMGMIALAVFAINSGVVVNKLGKRS